MVLGIDTGESGGIAAIQRSGKYTAKPMPETNTDIVSTLHFLCCERNEDKDVSVYIEDNTGYTGVPIPSSRAFKMGEFSGGPRMALLMLFHIEKKHNIFNKAFELDRVSPRKWQKIASVGKRGKLTKTQWKNKLKSRAQEIFTGINVTLKTADALLIAYYGRLMKGY